MATLGVEFFGPAPEPGNAFQLSGQVDFVSSNVEKNQTTIRIRHWAYSRHSAASFNINSWHDVWCDGYRVAEWSQNRAVSPNSWVEISNYTRTITHKADGTRSVTVRMQFGNTVVGALTTGNHAVTLASLPRATSPTVVPLTTGTKTFISLPRATSGFTHDVSYKIGSKSGTIATGAGVTAEFTPPDMLATEFPNAASRTIDITVVTRSGSTTVGTRTVPFTLTAGAEVVPSVSAVVWDDLNPTAKAIGGFVQGESLIVGAVTASGAHGSTIVERKLVAGGQTFNEGDVWQPATSGAVVAKGTAKDSRARSAERAAGFTVLPYSAPSLSALTTVSRATNASGTVGDGPYLRLDITAAVQSLEPATSEKNALKLLVRTRPKDGAWTTRNNITHTALAYAARMLMITGGAVYPVATSFDIEVTVTDNLGRSASRMYSVGTSGAALDLVGNAAGVGKLWERGALDVGGTAYAEEFRADDGVFGDFFQVAAGAQSTTYGHVSITTPYGQMGHSFRGTTAQRLALEAAGAVVDRMRFYDTTDACEYVADNGVFVREDTGWVDLTSLVVTAYQGNLIARRVGNLKEIRYTSSSKSIPAGVIRLATLPPIWRPTGLHDLSARGPAYIPGNNAATFQLQLDGVFNAVNETGAARTYFATSFMYF